MPRALHHSQSTYSNRTSTYLTQPTHELLHALHGLSGRLCHTRSVTTCSCSANLRPPVLTANISSIAAPTLFPRVAFAPSANATTSGGRHRHHFLRANSHGLPHTCQKCLRTRRVEFFQGIGKNNQSQHQSVRIGSPLTRDVSAIIVVVRWRGPTMRRRTRAQVSATHPTPEQPLLYQRRQATAVPQSAGMAHHRRYTTIVGQHAMVAMRNATTILYGEHRRPTDAA